MHKVYARMNIRSGVREKVYRIVVENQENKAHYATPLICHNCRINGHIACYCRKQVNAGRQTERNAGVGTKVVNAVKVGDSERFGMGIKQQVKEKPRVRTTWKKHVSLAGHVTNSLSSFFLAAQDSEAKNTGAQWMLGQYDRRAK
jgi:hypothetical protein